MSAILKIVAYFAAAVCLLLVLLVVLILLALVPRVRVDVDKPREGPLSLAVRYGWIRFRILPQRKKPASHPPAKPKAKKPAEKKPKKPRKKGGFSVKGIDVGDIICLALDILLALRDRLKIHRLCADVLLATGDAAKTGILLGRSAAITGMVLPLFEQNFVIPDFHIYVDGDFQCEKPATRAAFSVSISLRPIHVPLILFRFRRQLFALYRALRVKPEAGEEEPAVSVEKPASNPSNEPEKENVT